MQRLGSSCTNGYPVEEVNWGRVISEEETEVEYEVVATPISGKKICHFVVLIHGLNSHGLKTGDVKAFAAV